MTDICIREAQLSDAALILGFVKELADFENASDQVAATIQDIEISMFGPDSIVTALICEIDQIPAGFAVYFFNYSTWLGQKGLYLEDLYISKKYRGSGAGQAMLTFLAKTAVEQKCKRFEWSVLDWNTPAIDFYESLGGEPQKEWVRYRLSGSALKDLAAKEIL